MERVSRLLSVFCGVLAVVLVSGSIAVACPTVDEMEAKPDAIPIGEKSNLKAKQVSWNGYNQDKKYSWKVVSGPSELTKEGTKKNVKFPDDFTNTGEEVKAGVYNIVLDVTGTNSDGDSSSASDKQAASERTVSVKVVEVDHMEYMHEDCHNYTTGNPTISVGTTVSIKPIPNPQYSWPSRKPTWKIEEKPSGSSVRAPSDGRQSYSFTFDKKGTYRIKASCGTSSDEIRIIVKGLAINLISIYPGQGQEEILSDLLEDQFYWGRASLTGGSSSDTGRVIWRIRKADGSVEEHELQISFEDQELRQSFVTDNVDNAGGAIASWNYSSYVKAQIKKSGSILDWDNKNTTVHREWEVDQGSAWENDGWDPQNWQHFDTCQSGDSLTQSVTVEEKWSVSYSLTAGVSISAGAEGALKAQLGFTETFNIGYEVTAGFQQARTVAIPDQPSDKYWGVFWIREIENKICNAYKWDKYGNKTHDGTVELNRKALRLGRSHEPADNFTEAGSHFPRL